jgi:hypothetical protein
LFDIKIIQQTRSSTIKSKGMAIKTPITAIAKVDATLNPYLFQSLKVIMQ